MQAAVETTLTTTVLAPFFFFFGVKNSVKKHAQFAYQTSVKEKGFFPSPHPLP